MERTGINKKLLIVIPCYNEQGNIGKVLNALSQLSIPGVEITALPVNDCSKDNTLEEIRSHTHLYVNLPVNLGIGGAVQSGYKYAKKNGYDMALQFDGDGQHPVEYIHELIKPLLEDKANVVIGSRFLAKEGFQSSYLRRSGINYFRRVIRMLLGITISDSTSGFRAIDKKTIDVVCNYYPDTYPEPEAIILYHMNSLVIKEIPVVMKARESGTSSIGTFSSIYYMMKVSLGILFIYIRLKANGKRRTI
ncbi:MAG: glycosyl transferase family 2 [Bacteroidetes bacterium]|jgi:glycosyltransferase involved in cell wall biosynthesis|nr:glycosyl transferase family 2 [Bacteroidota bacterium]